MSIGECNESTKLQTLIFEIIYDCMNELAVVNIEMLFCFSLERKCYYNHLEAVLEVRKSVTVVPTSLGPLQFFNLSIPIFAKHSLHIG